MTELLRSDQLSFINRSVNIGTVCVIFLIPVSQFASVRVLLLVLAASLLATKFQMSWKQLFNFSWDVALYFLLLLIGLSYTQDLTTGFRVIETSFSLVAIPFAFRTIYPLNKRQLDRYINWFSFGLLIPCSICLINAVSRYAQGEPFDVFFYYDLTNIVESHPTYLAYYLIFGLTVQLAILDSDENKGRGWRVAMILFFFIVLLLTGGQTAYVSVLLVFSFFVLKYFLTEGSFKMSLVLVSVMVAVLFTFSHWQHQIGLGDLNDSWDRFELWNSALRANPSALLGVGTGDYKSDLNYYLQTHGFEQYARESFNSHNQFIQIFFSNGMLGVISLLVMMIRPIYMALKNGDALGILVFFPFATYGMTEVFLGRYQGVVFFAVLHQIFIQYYKSLEQSYSLKGA